jgi:hypothetical protein
MEISYARSSLLGSYAYCQLKTYITYNLGIQEPSQLKANLGTITHKALEILANCKKQIQDNPKNKKFIFNDTDFGEIKYSYKTLMSEEFVKTILNLSYEYYTKNTPHLNYIRNEHYPFCEKMVDACLNINSGQFDPRKMNILQAECPFDLEVKQPWANGLRLKGTMDLLTLGDSDTIEYVDYKTGARKDWATGEIKDLPKLQKDIQLLLYYYAIRQIFPQYKNVIMTIFFLRDGGPFTVLYDSKDEEYFMNELKRLYIEIKNNKNPKPINRWRSDFRCQKLCHYYKTNWPETKTNICQYVEDNIKLYGIEETTQNLKKKGFETSFYQSPGSVK